MIRRIFPLLLAATAVVHARTPAFRAHTLATDLTGGYQVVASDVNADGRMDLIALASRISELVWFESPTWQRHSIGGSFERMINLAAHDLDGDRIPEILLAHAFENDPRKSIGRVSILRHQGDPRKPWSAKEIDKLPSAHRIRVAVFEKGKPVFVNAPLAGADVGPPSYDGEVPLVYYAPDGWKRQVIDSRLRGVVHGLTIFDWDADGIDEALTASFEGVLMFRKTGGGWTRTRLAAGDTAPWPKSGASEIAIGKRNRRRFLATVEPWHGNQIAIYTGSGSAWARNVIDKEQADVHSIQTADLDGDGSDEVVAAVRGPQRRVAVYSADAAGKWERTYLDDGGIAAASCTVADLNRDRLPDIACIGSATSNLKWYENLGRH